MVYQLQCYVHLLLTRQRDDTFSQAFIYMVAQNKIPHQTVCNISATSGLIPKILEAA